MKITNALGQLTSNFSPRKEIVKATAPEVPSEMRPPLSSDAAVIRITNGGSRQRLEKHLNDHKTGQGHLSRGMYSEVSRMREGNATMLADLNPDAAALNSAYQTLNDSYASKARNAQFMKTVVTQMKNLTAAYATQDLDSKDIEKDISDTNQL